jgi:voltage-gated potassium channel
MKKRPAQDARETAKAAARPYTAQAPASYGEPPPGWRRHIYRVVFESDTRAGRRFDILLVILIVLSIIVVILDSVPSIRGHYKTAMRVLEWVFTFLFTLEYLARLLCVARPARYATGFFGVIDLLSVLPTYLSLFVPGAAGFLNIRILRLLRVFRIFKLALYIEEYTRLGEALKASGRKILVFLSVVLMAVLILGTAMYVVEGPEHGYTSIPMAMYWAVVTMTTVGYGDITPGTNLGKMLASFMMLLGWGILAVPTGIVTAEMTSQRFTRRMEEAGKGNSAGEDDAGQRPCPACGSAGHAIGAKFCKDCGGELAHQAK